MLSSAAAFPEPECVVCMESESKAWANPAIVELTRWFETPAGRYILAWEQSCLDEELVDVFGYNAVQVGLPEFDTLRANRIPFKVYLGLAQPTPEQSGCWQAQVQATPEALPFASQSLDLLVLPHVMEYVDDPHRVLREAERVLIPEGRVVMTGFNPFSLWGLRQRLAFDPWLPSEAQCLLAHRLKDWCQLLSLDVEHSRYGCYAPPVRSARWLQRYGFMERAGARWWPVAGAIYMVSAVKRVSGMRLIEPPWKKSPRAAHAPPVAAPSQKTSTPGH